MTALLASWEELARCATHGDPDDFHPDHGMGRPSRAVLAAYGRALAVCAACPVRGACYDAHAGEPFGVWGGTTPNDRGYFVRPHRNTSGPGRPGAAGPVAERARNTPLAGVAP